MDSACYVCKKPITGSERSTNLDYCTATGRKKLPGLGSRNFDLRYGFLVHVKCADKKRAQKGGA